MKTILFGNGFNRLNNVTSWENLVHVIDDSKDKYIIPNTLQYEGKVLSEPYQINEQFVTSDGLLFVASDKKILTVREYSETIIKKSIVSEMEKYTSNELFNELLNLNVNHFMTTNYDYVTEKSFENLSYYEDKLMRDKSESIFSIHRRKCFIKNNFNKQLWKIHGELSNIGSIMLGYYHYCSYIGQIKKSLFGEYEFGKKRDLGIIPKIEERLNNGINEILSWIDLVFTSDIYIIGLGLYYDEIDLWWLLTIRKRLKLKLGEELIKNEIVYYGEPESGKKSMLEHLDVKVVSSNRRTYKNKYEDYIKDIKKHL